ncbi:class I SAM-dependent methyltransferase [Streptomyces sp. ADMS]|uniref:class I SAM-dependent methyltransferase n=1 Tax=Streptomyces sp. ADMS TaxID=3071415 RepID=UPI00296EA431|nr:class I SAM-dependent methyltransferase [Streptomyces sp. ADMS]MDW4911330.1 class I SAM-dependent methyltransferase [Streptomyces sp. ADMS]
MTGLYADPMRQPAAEPYWNTNVARHPGILRSVPEGCGDALDVGCGDGLLARKLAGRAKHVTGIDKSPDMIASARELAAGHPQLTFVEGDFLTAELPRAEYDFVCSVTTIHHMDFEAALVRMRELLRPGGTLVVVGLAREASVTEWAALIAAAPIVRIMKVLRRARGPQGMPVADPQMSYGQVRAAARRALPPACAAPVLADLGETRPLIRRRWRFSPSGAVWVSCDPLWRFLPIDHG